MLQLKNISKVYGSGENAVHALKGVSLNFRKCELVSILGPSGCGKSTMLNIVGGLDRYTQGDLVINGKSTKNFSDRDWDTYRNHSIGFVFQSYNLVSHLSVLDNVALSLSIAGEKRSVRIQKAKEALTKVGLQNMFKKRPNQLSGGQMQRVAIARAIVNNPDIILADEPTGALDSETGLQVMQLLKEVATDRLVIMVTHNEQLANDYSTRIINLFDGEVTGDTMPCPDEELAQEAAPEVKQEAAPEVAQAAPSPETVQEAAQQATQPQPARRKKKRPRTERRSKMSIFSAFLLSAKNLLTKKGRTLLTSFAGSIGIFGIAIVLAISGGMNKYVDILQTEAVIDNAVVISETTIDLNNVMDMLDAVSGDEAYPKNEAVKPYVNPVNTMYAQNTITQEYVDYVARMDSSLYETMDFSYHIRNINVFHQEEYGYSYKSSFGGTCYPITDNLQLLQKNYDVLYKTEDSKTGFPSDCTEISLVVDKYNHVSLSVLNALGVEYDKLALTAVPFEDIVGMEYTVVLNDGMYEKKSNGLYGLIPEKNFAAAVEGEHTLKIQIVSILRIKNDNASNLLSIGIGYHKDLAKVIIEDSKKSEVGLAQIASTDKNVISGAIFESTASSSKQQQYVSALKRVSAYDLPTDIRILPVNATSKNKITQYLDSWNNVYPENAIKYTDYTGMVMNILEKLINAITYVLVAFSAIALAVSTVMISVITYTSVVERKKEIGVLRSLGARKFDIANIFNAETTIIGALAGAIGIIFSAIGGAITNSILKKLFHMPKIVLLTPQIIFGMLGLSIGLTILAGLIPASLAARKDPVVALRSE